MQIEENRIQELINLLCDRLQEWGEGESQYSIGDIDKAASTLKKLQEISEAERKDTTPEDTGFVVTHHIPRVNEEVEE